MNTSPAIEATLTDMAYGGTAFGRLDDGRAVFVPFALPGERVRVELTEEKGHFAHARLLEILHPSEKRTSPLCRHFGECGGCHYQHLGYEHQLEVKAAILEDQLRRIGGFDRLPQVEVVASPLAWGYRNVLQFHSSPQGKLGFQRSRSEETVEITQCELPLPPLQGAWNWMEFDPQAGVKRLTFRCGVNDEILLTLESDSPETPYVEVEEIPLSIVHLSPAGALILAGSDHLWMEVNQRLFHLSAGAFFQVNTASAGRLVDHLLNQLDLNPKVTLCDVYCGGGLYSAFLAPHVERLIGIENSEAACRDFVINLNEFDNIELYEADAEDVLPYLDVHVDVMVIDPPRSGLAKAARQAIISNPPQTLVYISCDPSTLSRDARYLAAAGFELQSLTLIDMFPQTYHLESVSLWRYRHTP